MTNRFTELLAVLESDASNRSIEISGSKRRETVIAALRIADTGLVEAMQDLLNYTGGWDLPINGDHPISKARAALFRAQLLGTQLLTEHPPCEMVAKPFDLSTLTFGSRHLLGRLRNGPLEGDNFTGNPSLELLQTHGLVKVEKHHGDRTGWRTVTLSAKGKAAK